MKKTIIIIVNAFILNYAVAQINLGIKLNEEHQKIEGCGGSTAYGEWLKNETSPPETFWTDGWGNVTFDFLGATLIGVLLPVDFQTSDQQYHYDSYQIKQQIYALRKMKEKGVERYYLHVNTPPAWMKTTGVLGGGKLKPENFDVFSDYILEYMEIIKDSCDIDFYALCPQTYAFAEMGYLSCIYTIAEYHSIIKKVFSKINNAGFYPLGVIDPYFFSYEAGKSYVDAALADTSVAKFVDVIATGGEADFSSSTNLAMAEKAHELGLQAWRTNIWGYSGSWESAMEYGSVISKYLVGYNYNAFMWAELNHFSESDGHENMMAGSNISYRTAVAAHYWKYARPGSVRIGTTGGANMFAVKSDSEGYVAITVQNNNAVSREYVLDVDDLPGDFFVYRSVEDDYMKLTDTIKANEIVTVAPGSLYTFVYKAENMKPQLDQPQKDFVYLVNTIIADTIPLTGIDFRDDILENEFDFLVESSDTTVIPHPELVYSFPDSTASLIIHPKNGQSGNVIISIKISDKSGDSYFHQVTHTFAYRVISDVNNAPIINDLKDIYVLKESGIRYIQLSDLSDGNDGNQSFVFFDAVSSNESIAQVSPLFTPGSTSAEIAFLTHEYGSTTITVWLQDDGRTDFGGTDMMQTTFRINVVATLNLSDVERNQIAVFPNPTTNFISVNSEKPLGTISIYNIFGKLMFYKYAESNSIKIEVADLPKGIYLMEVLGLNEKQIVRIVKH